MSKADAAKRANKNGYQIEKAPRSEKRYEDLAGAALQALSE